MELTDRELLIQFTVARDEQAFVTLVRRYERLVRAACRRVLRDVHLADDAFQAAFLVLAARANTLCHRHESLAPWLYTVAANAALQLRRSRNRTQRREQQVRPVADTSALSELLEMLDEELQRLDRPARDAIVLCHLQGLTQDDAAAVLGVSKSTLRRHLNRGLESLRGRFRRRGLLVPMFAVLWNAVTDQQVTAADAATLQPLAESARQVSGPMPWGRHDWKLSEASWNLSRKVLVMSRWNQIRSWSVWGLSGGVALSIAWLALMAQSDAAEKGVKPAITAQGKHRAAHPASVTTAKPSPGAAAELALTIVPQPVDETAAPAQSVTTLAAAKKSKSPAAAKANPGKLGNTPPLQAAPVVVQAQGAKTLSIAGGAAGGMSGGATSTNNNGVFSGTVNINGREIKTDNPAEFQRLLQMQQAAFPQLPGFPQLGNGFPNLKGNGAAAGGFSGGGAATSTNGPNGFQGTVNINGQQQTFNNQADFDKALKGLNLPVLIGQ